jgi:two-component system sensor histidine kinase ChiS
MGSSIAEQKIQNKEKIAEILSGKLFGNTVAKDLFSFTIFSWISPQKKIIISGLCGILREPKDVSFRNYAKMADKEPWKLHLDHPGYAVPTERFILPAGMGITSKDGSFLGIISMGFNLSNLNKEIKAAIKDDRIKYVIIFDDRTLVIQSDDGGKAPIINSKNIFFENKTSPLLLPKAIKSDKNTYIYYKKFNDYPFVVLVGYSHEALYTKLYQKIFPRIIELLSIAAFSIIMLFILKK